MGDLVDKAQELEELQLKNTLNNRASFQGVSLSECLECGDDIPLQRRAIGGVKYCVGCQSYFERKR